MVLIHWPGVTKLKHDDAKNKELRNESWKALEELKDEGHIKHIGVSNFNIKHLNDLMSSCKYKPEVN